MLILLIGIIIIGLGSLTAYQAYEWRFNYLYYYAAGLIFSGIGLTLIAAIVEDYSIWDFDVEHAMFHLLFGTIYTSLGLMFIIVGSFKIGRLRPNYIDILYAIGLGFLIGLPFASDLFKYEIDRPNVISLDVTLSLEIILTVYLIMIIPNGYLLFKKIKELKPIKFNSNYENAKKAFFVLLPFIFLLSMGAPAVGITGIVPLRVFYALIIGITLVALGYFIVSDPLIFAFISEGKGKYLEIMVLVGSYTVTTKVMSTTEESEEFLFDTQIRGTAIALINDFVRSAEKSNGKTKKEFFEHSYSYSSRSVIVIQKDRISLVVISSINNPQLKKVYKALLNNIIKIVKMYMDVEDILYGEIDYKMVVVINHLINKYVPLDLKVVERREETENSPLTVN